MQKYKSVCAAQEICVCPQHEFHKADRMQNNAKYTSQVHEPWRWDQQYETNLLEQARLNISQKISLTAVPVRRTEACSSTSIGVPARADPEESSYRPFRYALTE